MPLIGRNTRIEIQKTLDSPKTITAITLAKPPVCTSTSHGYTNGDVVVLINMGAQADFEGQIARVANVATNTFELEGMDATGFPAFTAGTASKISAWSTLGEARTMTAGGASPATIDATTLLDTETQTVLGATPSPTISIDQLSNPLSEAAGIIESAARSAAYLGFRVTLSDASRRVFRGQVSLPAETIPLGALVTSSFSVTQWKRRLAFAT